VSITHIPAGEGESIWTVKNPMCRFQSVRNSGKHNGGRTPAAGAGIKYAIEDAVVAANVLTAPLETGRVRVQELAEVQRRR
jgi:hypothetical protein